MGLLEDFMSKAQLHWITAFFSIFKTQYGPIKR